MSEPLLALAADLERREALAAGEAAGLEALARELDEVRTSAEATVAFLDGLPAAQRALEAEGAAAESARVAAVVALAEAEAQLAEARREEDRPALEREVRRARDALHEADRHGERAAAERSRLAGEAERRRGEAVELETRARAFAGSLGEMPRVAHEAASVTAPGLAGVLEWAEEARGALLLASAGLAVERDRTAREATELLAAVSGNPSALAAAVGIRERLARELDGGAP